MRVILFTGKGGVGKTSVAAATALRSARLGHKTIIISTDAAHSLSDCFDFPLSGEAQPILPNLWGMETSVTYSLEKYWRTVQEWLSAFLAWRGMDELIAQEAAILPGMEELANLLYIQDFARNGDYEAVIVDCAPTGESLRLLSFPEVLNWWMEKVFPWERRAVSIARPLLRSLSSIPLPEDKVFEAAQGLFGQLKAIKSLLTDPEVASIRLVVNAEKMVIKEAQRSFTYFNLYGYATDMVVCNRLFPQELREAYFEDWKEIQWRHLQTIEECFSPIPVFTVPLFPQEVVGFESLDKMAEALYQDNDPLTIFWRGRPQHIFKQDDHYILELSLPFADKKNLSLYQGETELIIQVGSYRRNVFLPRALWGQRVAEAKFEESKLRLKFTKEARNGEDFRDRQGGGDFGDQAQVAQGNA